MGRKGTPFPPPIYASKRSPPQIVMMLWKGTRPLSVKVKVKVKN